MNEREEDRLTPKRAKDREEYDEAARIVQWLRARAQERINRGYGVSGSFIAVAANQIAEHFLLPDEGAP